MNDTPAFENNIFISYAHIDNKPLTDGQRGWIDEFHYALETRLNQLLGAVSTVWRDKKLHGNDVLDESILKRFPKTALLVIILSPRYLNSEWCLRELHEFYRASEQSGGIRYQDKSRVFKVVKTYIPLDEHPKELQDVLGYEFYEEEQGTNRHREFVIDPKDESFKKFRLKLDDLAYDILDLLKILAPPSAKVRTGRPTSSGEMVYLAETTSDLTEARNQIKRELVQRGHNVLPERPLPLKVSHLHDIVRDNLIKSKLSVHLIGANYGLIPEGADHSVVRLQVDLAQACSKERPFSRVLWVPPELKAESRQEEFLAYLRTTVTQEGAELIEDSLEELKTTLKDKLTATTRKSQVPIRSNGNPRVYLMCDKQDLKEVFSLQEHLFHEGIEVILPATEGEETQVRDNHKENLLWCDAALIYYATGKDFWFWTMFRDLDKSRGYGRKERWLAKVVYIAPPKTDPKEGVLINDAIVIRNYESFKPELLEPFIAKLKGT
jgi:hypothetical protein